MKKRLLSVICASVVATSLFAGCSSTASDGGDGKGEVTLKVLTHRTYNRLHNSLPHGNNGIRHALFHNGP